MELLMSADADAADGDRSGRGRGRGVTATPAPARTQPRRAAVPHVRSLLPSGLRVRHPVDAGRPVGERRDLRAVGSRHEDEAHAGLSHLLEHLVFKGTRDHPEPGALSQVVEGVGGSINASTDRELTVYSSKVPARAAASRSMRSASSPCTRSCVAPT
jgi:zinc protease